ncbi:UNVERIFIED_CONTAM: hypothetical protein HDU68_008217 [Siphonaria sp. JEL0065]|nr:hypothetical protein HDU68_008217 [Siphonaria sp. JEL0065]
MDQRTPSPSSASASPHFLNSSTNFSTEAAVAQALALMSVPASTVSTCNSSPPYAAPVATASPPPTTSPTTRKLPSFRTHFAGVSNSIAKDLGSHQRFLTPPTSGCVRATKAQLKVLEQIFEGNPMPSASMHKAIAERIGMTKQTVRNWFQNQRAKVRRNASEGDKSAAVKVQYLNQIQHDRNSVKYAPLPPNTQVFSNPSFSEPSRISVNDLI